MKATVPQPFSARLPNPSEAVECHGDFLLVAVPRGMAESLLHKAFAPIRVPNPIRYLQGLFGERIRHFPNPDNLPLPLYSPLTRRRPGDGWPAEMRPFSHIILPA